MVTLTGLSYPLAWGTLPADACLGLGNSVARRGAAIGVHEGFVTVLVETGTETFGHCRPWRAAAG